VRPRGRLKMSQMCARGTSIASQTFYGNNVGGCTVCMRWPSETITGKREGGGNTHARAAARVFRSTFPLRSANRTGDRKKQMSCAAVWAASQGECVAFMKKEKYNSNCLLTCLLLRGGYKDTREGGRLTLLRQTAGVL
jgi:hypothetical protein